MTLQNMLDDQDNLQVILTGKRPGFLEGVDRIQFIKDMHIALTDELHEALNEVGWKPWATSRHFNRDAFVDELIDSWHFFMNLLLVAGVTEEELAERYDMKRLKNIQRKKDKYDGVSTKCPRCHRDYNDTYVNCTPKETNGMLAYCSRDDFYINENGDLA